MEPLIFERAAAWFERPDGARVDCQRFPLLRRLLVPLVEARLRTPGLAVARERLIAAGWPGERIAAPAARNRMNVAITRLRRLGLGGALVARGPGFLLDEAVAVEIREM